MKIYPAVMPDGRLAFSEMTVAMNAWSISARADEGMVSNEPQKLVRDVMQNFRPAVAHDGSRAAFSGF